MASKTSRFTVSKVAEHPDYIGSYVNPNVTFGMKLESNSVCPAGRTPRVELLDAKTLNDVSGQGGAPRHICNDSGPPNSGPAAGGQKSRTPFLRMISAFSASGGSAGVASADGPCNHDNSSRKSSTYSTTGAIKTPRDPYGSRLVRSFRYCRTLERLPHVDNYRLDVMSIADAMRVRPTMSDLLTGDRTELTPAEVLPDVEGGGLSVVSEAGDKRGRRKKAKDAEKADPGGKVAAPAHVGNKFGWVKGVMVRCFLNILGVMLFMRLSWITGQAGIGLATVIILLSSTVSLLTTISMCAICTNGEVKGGGVYFMISRSLGPPFGGAIGVIFSFANAVAVGMHVVGFAETVRDLIKEQGATIVDNGTNDIRIIGVSTVALLLVICLVGLEFEAIMQVGLMVILTAALVNYVVGSFTPPDLEDKAMGILGYNAWILEENFVPQYRGEYNFIKLFAIFFPSVTGIAAGANISGDLADPQVAIPKGTLLAILLTDLIYIGVVWMTGSTTIRDASGSIEDYLAGNFTKCAEDFSCKYGIMNYYQVMEKDSSFGPLITAGIFAATLSSALACLVSAPKIFQAVCKDRLFPKIHVLAKGYGKNEEPKRLYVMSFCIAVCIILIGDLNVIAPIISNFYLAVYSLMNYACFDATISKSPGFRPSFKYYNKFTALLGSALCVAVMFIMNWYYALVTYAIIAIIYVYLLKKKPDVNWGSSTDANLYKNALRLIYKLQGTTEHVKTYRPQIMVLTGNPCHRPSLVDFVGSITKNTSLMICGHVVPTSDLPEHDKLSQFTRYREAIRPWFKRRKVRSFYAVMAASSLSDGVQNLLQTSGLSKLRPNILMLGFKNNCHNSPLAETSDYFKILVDAFEANLGVAIFRLGHGLDYSELIRMFKLVDKTQFPIDLQVGMLSRVSTAAGVQPTKSGESETDDNDDDEVGDVKDNEKQQGCCGSRCNCVAGMKKRITAVRQSMPQLGDKPDEPTVRIDLAPYRAIRSTAVLNDEYEVQQAQAEIMLAINQFQGKSKKPTVDVYWLYDDGGLTLLLPYLLLSGKSHFAGARMRVFTLASSRGTIREEQKDMATLLQKFRIRAADVVVIPDIMKRPRIESLREFDKMVSKFMVPGLAADKPDGVFVTEEEMIAMKDKTYRHIRTRELLQENSADAGLIVLTLPVPRKSSCPAGLYLTWLDYLTKNMPPVLLVRGNQQSVLTYYS